MIILITTMEKDETTGRDIAVISHGVDTETGRHVILPSVAPDEIGEFWESAGEWVMFEEEA